MYLKRNIVLRVLIAPLFFVTLISTAQSNDLFKGYRKTAWVLEPIIFEKNTTDPQAPEIDLTTYNTFTGNLGFTYRFLDRGAWNFKTGFILGLQPGYHLSANFKAEDIIFDEDQYFKINELSNGRFSFTIPLEAQFTTQVASRTYLAASLAAKLTYLSPNQLSYSIATIDEEAMEFREIFLLEIITTETGLYPQLTFGTGFYFTLKKMLLYAGFTYNKNIINTYSGRYVAGNLLVTPRLEGEYKNSGDYFGLSTSVAFNLGKKNKKRNKYYIVD